MKKKICVYTCITGNYDNLNELIIKDNNVDFICYTNNKNLKSKTWNVIYTDDKALNNHQLSRKIKMIGTDYINKNYEISVWQDASVIWKKKPSLFVEKYLTNVFSAFIHNERQSVFEEAQEVIRLKKDDKKSVLNHIKFLEKEEFPDNMGLYEMTVFIKKHNDPIVKETMHIWYETYFKYSKRDQLSFMYAAWKTDLKISPIKMNVWNNQWIEHTKHNYKEELNSCRIAFEEIKLNSIDSHIYDYKYKINNEKYSVTTKIPIDTETIEIEVTDVPCLIYKDFKINCEYESIQIYNTIPYNDSNIFYNNKGLIVIKGRFKKNEKLHFSIRLKKLNSYEKYDLIEQLSTTLIAASEDIEILKQQKKELNKIINDQKYLLQHPIRNTLKYIRNTLKYIKNNYIK